MNVSKRLLTVPASPIRKLAPFATQAKKQGVKIYHLNIGDPDIESPKPILDSLKNWTKPQISYAQSQGEPVFLQAVLGYYHHLGYKFLTKDNIQITFGGSEAIAIALFAIANPGDEILVFEPFYTNYQSFAIYSGVKLVPLATSIDRGFHLPSLKEIEKKITKKTRAILFCNPSNPTGTVLTMKEMRLLVDLTKKHQLFIIADEVYREFVFDDKKHVSLFTFMREIPDQAIVVDSLSKRYSLCGARLGMLVSLNKQIMDGALRIAQGRLSVGMLDQKIASNLTKVDQSYFNRVRHEYQNRRDVLYEGLKQISGVIVSKPEGAFYLIVGLPVDSAEDFCRWLLTDFRLNSETVMLAPANGFYATPGLGKNEVRIAYVLKTEDLKKSLRILEKALSTYNHKKIINHK